MNAVLKLDVEPQVSVRYGESFNSEEPYKLLEVNDAILQDLLDNGLTIKGCLEDEAVLCTSKATYAMKFVSTSNTVLLIPARKSTSNENGGQSSSKAEVGVVATASGHIELVETVPRLENLNALVSLRPYNDDEDGADDGALYTWDELSACTQASDYQLREALRKLEASEIGKYWRVVDPEYMHNLLEILLSSAVQHDWPLNALSGSEVLPILEADNFPRQVVINCLDKFGIRSQPDPEPKEGRASEDKTTETEGFFECTSQTWALDEHKICLHYAKRLLAAKDKWKVEDFVEEWQMITPSWMNAHLNMLKGEILVEKIGLESWICQFSSSLLPTRPDGRFSALFKRRSKWEWEDLEPYLRDLKVPGQSVEAMLLKYTRKSQPTPTSIPVYTAR